MAQKKFSGLWILLGVMLILVMWMAGVYNSLTRLDLWVDNAWANVETQYQRRADLVPQLISTVQGAADFEQSTLTAVTEARTQWLNAASSGDRTGQIRAANQFDSALSRLLVSVEAYPTLNATRSFQDLQSQLEGTENRIQVARRDYNTAVTSYNTKVRIFPGNLLAQMFGFSQEDLFEASAGTENAPEVKFNFDN